MNKVNIIIGILFVLSIFLMSMMFDSQAHAQFGNLIHTEYGN